MIVDLHGNIYKVENSVWWGQFNRAEEWAKVDKGKTYRIRGAGIRWGFMGWYPNIYRINRIKNLD